ncbi:MAG: hypothetical protein LBR80_09620 [Deltaproteobacteria bacterium]|nr:hypothetical protein [Deltaproteobacteria bacterium]
MGFWRRADLGQEEADLGRWEEIYSSVNAYRELKITIPALSTRKTGNDRLRAQMSKKSFSTRLI